MNRCMRISWRSVALAACLATCAGEAGAVEPGESVPALSAPAFGARGSPVVLAGLRGRVFYVDFWASWCVPCRLSMPALDALQRRHEGAGFLVLGVNKDFSRADAERFLKRVNVGFALLEDPEDALARAFGVKAMPSGYLVDRKGIVRKVHRGFSDATAAELGRDIEALLKEPA